MDVATRFQLESVEKVENDVAVTLYPSAREEHVHWAG